MDLRATEPLELLVVQPTSFCNLDCRYCYVPDRDDRRVAARRMLERLRDLLRASSRLPRDRPLEILWHAGEPLAAGLSFYHMADEIFADLPADVAITRTFQTNATLITADWCRYFTSVDARVGVSIDGPRVVHDANRTYRNGRGSFEATMRGVRLLRDHGIALNALMVLTEDGLSRAEAIYDFLCEEQITNVGFNVEETEGVHARSRLSRSPEARQLFARFMRTFIDLNGRDGNRIVVRELRAALHYLARRSADPNFIPDEAESRIGRILTISRDGDIFSFSPELASGVDADPKRFSLGNVLEIGSIDEALQGETARRMQAEIDEGRRLCRSTCRYFAVCGSGSPANKFYENGTFASTETIKCVLHTQAMMDLLLDLAGERTRR
jgi:uncharacterized protein